MQMLLQHHLAQLWPMLAELSPTQERQLGAAKFTTAHLIAVQHLDQNLAAAVFVGFLLIVLAIAMVAALIKIWS
jgi:hypothetical protein